MALYCGNINIPGYFLEVSGTWLSLLCMVKSARRWLRRKADSSGASIVQSKEKSQVLSFLEAKGLLGDTEHVINQLGIQTCADLKYMFRKLTQAQEAGLGVQWEACSKVSTARVQEVLDMARVVAQEARAIKYVPVKAGKAKGFNSKKPVNNPTEDLARRKEVAKNAVALSLSWAPGAGLARGLKVVKKVFLDRCVDRVAYYEPNVVNAALSCWDKWCVFAKENGLEPTNADWLQWETFIMTRSSAATMCRSSWHQACWLFKVLRAPIPANEIPRPPKRASKSSVDTEGQTPVAEPELMLLFEEKAAEFAKSGDWRLGVLVGALIEGYAGTRHAHLARSRLISKSDLFIRASVYRGKAGETGSRPGFTYFIPCCTISGFPLGDILWDNWNRCCKEAGKVLHSTVLNYNTGASVGLQTFNDVLHEVGSPIISQVDGSAKVRISSYWLRSFPPTLADIRNAPWGERLHLGKWAVGKTGVSSMEQNLMPLRYARSKEDSEKYVKLLHMVILQHCSDRIKSPVTWDKVRTFIESSGDTAWRQQTASELEKESEYSFAFGTEELDSKARGVKRVITTSRHSITKKAITNSKPSKEIEVKNLRVPPFNPEEFGWIGGSERAKAIHFIRIEEPELAICKQNKAGPKQKFPVWSSGPFTEAGAQGKYLCATCLKRLPIGAVRHLAKKAPDFIVSQIRQYRSDDCE